MLPNIFKGLCTKILFVFISGVLDSSNSLVLDHLLNVFEPCSVHIYNYKGLTLSVLYKPVVISTNISFEIKPELSTQLLVPVDCQLALHILPIYANKKARGKGNRRYSRIPKIKTKIQYNILVDNQKQKSRKLWIASLTRSLYHDQSFSMIAEVDDSLVNISDKVEIIDNFKISYNRKIITTSVNLNELIGNSGLLYQTVLDIHNHRKYKDIQWTLASPLNTVNPSEHITQDLVDEQVHHLKRVQNMLKMGFGSPAYAKLLEPTTVSEEGLVNFLFAFIVLGTDTNATDPITYAQTSEFVINPRIKFNVRQGPLMTNSESRETAYISCSAVGGPMSKQYTFLEVVMELISQFELRIYYALIATYVVPSIILGLLYHFLIKKRIQKKYWVTWQPFTWGLRSLIGQAGDRRLNSSRFGWTTFMVAPLLLVAVVISFAFRGSNIKVLTVESRMICRWNVLETQYKSGVTLVTDNPVLQRELKSNFEGYSYKHIAEQVSRDSSVTYISWRSRVMAVANHIGRRCPNTWQPPKIGRVGYWSLYFVSRYASYALRSEPSEWMIENWVDNGIIHRLGILNGESGIFEKWRESLKRVNEYRQVNDNWGRWVSRITMRANISYVFLCAAGGFAVALVIWLVEWVFYKAYTQPRRKWKKKLESGRKRLVDDGIIEKVDSGNGSIASAMSLEDDLVNKAVSLVNERRRPSPFDAVQFTRQDLPKDRDGGGGRKLDGTAVVKSVTFADDEPEIIMTCAGIEISDMDNDDEAIQTMDQLGNTDKQEDCSSVSTMLDDVSHNHEASEPKSLVDGQDNSLKSKIAAVEETLSTNPVIKVTRNDSFDENWDNFEPNMDTETLPELNLDTTDNFGE